MAMLLTTSPSGSRAQRSCPTHKHNPQRLVHSRILNLGRNTRLRFKQIFSTIPRTVFLLQLSNNAWDEQDINNDIVDYVTPFNVYDPTVESIDYFNPGGLYAEGTFDISAVTNNYGNTPVDFDIEATVYSATPSDVYCGTPSAVCVESFEGGSEGYRLRREPATEGRHLQRRLVLNENIQQQRLLVRTSLRYRTTQVMMTHGPTRPSPFLTLTSQA